MRQKTIGLIGGMSWQSTQIYYRLINETVQKRLGKNHSAKINLISFDFEEIVQLQATGQWNIAEIKMIEAAQSLEQQGSDFILICTNTMHRFYETLTEAVHIPILHIADITAYAIQAQQLKTVGLLGTRYTMTENFYHDRLAQYGLKVITPNTADQTAVHDIIFDELCKGIIKARSQKTYQRVIQTLVEQGAEGIVLGCTEIGILIGAEDVSTALFDTTTLHAMAAVDEALSSLLLAQA